jgi:hypothetical protein
MLEKKDKYDPATYGQLRSDFLNKLDLIPSTFNTVPEDEEKLRQEIMKQIKEGKLVTVKQTRIQVR